MKFYHIDRHCSLTIGEAFPYLTPPALAISKIFPVVSRHGVSYLFHNAFDYVCMIDELVLEYVRYTMFPKIPSRFQCFFASKTVEEAQQWATFWNLEHYRIAEIETDRFYELDCSWFTDTAKTGALLTAYTQNAKVINNGANARIFEEAVKYWSGQRSDHPRIEVLIPFPFSVVKLTDV